MIKIFIICFVFVLFDCSGSVSSNNAKTINKNQSQSPVSVETNHSETQNKNSSSVKKNRLAEKDQNELSECAKNKISYLPKGANIEQSLCYDSRKPVDKTEIVRNPKVNSAYNAENSEIVATDIDFEKLPKDVQQVVKQTSPEIETSDISFSLTMNVIDDSFYKKKMVLVKSYIFASKSKDEKPGKDKNYHVWTFLRQNGQLKLHSAEIMFP